jgi:transposase
MRYIGLDVHKDNITACVLSSTGKVKYEHDYVRDSDHWDLSELLTFGDKNGYCVMMESGTYAYQPYRFFADRGAETHVVHAHSLKIITESDSKTDRKDALSIAKMLRLWKRGEIGLSMSFMPTKEQCELKDICRYREEVSRKLGDETRRIKSQMMRNGQILPAGFDNFQTMKSRKYVSETYPDDLTLMRRMASLEDLFDERDRMQAEVESRLPGDRNVELLSEIPGIGRQTAIQIMSMIIDIDRFDDPEKFCSYFGMVPKVRDSGGSEHHGRMTKKGDRMMRMIMERATESHVHNCNSTVTRYYKKTVKRMGTKKALITASRKMMSMIYSILKNKRCFRIDPSV